MINSNFYSTLLWLCLVSFSCNHKTTKTSQTLLQESKILPQKLSCEYVKNPSVVDVKQPRLAWINNMVKGNDRGLFQSAYQIRVATTSEKLEQPDLWDSGKILSDVSNRIKYKGKNLESRQECWWQVRVWDGEDNPSPWSEPSTWRMGLLKKSDWKAKWIGVPWQGEEALPKPDGGPDEKPKNMPPPAPLLRKEFNIKKKIKKSVAYVTGLGYFELYTNGNKIGDDVLVPNQTNYSKRPGLSNTLINVEDNFRKYKVMYLAYDITSKLVQGKNTIGGILGNGFYNPAKFWTAGYGTPRFLVQIYITYEDGSEDVIISDENWKVSKGPILMDMVYYGENYDAREEKKGWSTVDFDDSQWKNAIIRKAPEGDLVAHTSHPDRIMERLEPTSIVKLENGNYKVDFVKEVSGWVRLKNIKGPKGHRIDISFNGNQYSGDNSYTLNGEGIESYAPRFNWFVFSGVEIKNWPGELTKKDIIAEAVNTYVEESATFETSNQLFNNINKIWRTSQLDNMHGGIASDCPHRERSGYTGDGQVACSTVMHNFDVQNFYQKWIQDMFDSQNIDTGYVPNGVPWQPGCGGGVAWGAAICIMPWEFYLHYGAVDMLEDNYLAMKEYIRYMNTWVDEDGIMFSQRKGGNGEIIKWYNLGEWASASELPPNDLVHTFYYWMCADITSKTAKALGYETESEKYKNIAESSKKAFQKRFYDENNNTYGNGGANILALKMGLPDNQINDVLKSLVNNIENNKGHLDTGIFGTRYFFEVLAENNLNHLAYQAMNKTDEPSYGHWLTLGSTTTREQWSEKGSHNHPMFGGGLVWFYRNLAGMRTDPEMPGYKHIIFKPQPVEELDFVRYETNTTYGKAGITWRNTDTGFIMDITVPIGSSATVYVPEDEIHKITENGLNVKDRKDLEILDHVDNSTIFKVNSGHYSFKITP